MRSRPRFGAGWFFALTLGFTWALQAPAAIAKLGIVAGGDARFGGLAAIGAFGPLVAAVALSFVEARWAGVRALFRPPAARGLAFGWYVVALAIFVVVNVAGALAYRAFTGRTDVHWLYLPSTAQHYAGLVMMPLLEEPGWRGFAQPRLAERFGPLRASFVIGIVHVAWHTMMWVIAGLDVTAFAVAGAIVLFGAVPFGWLHRRTGGSVAIAIVAHVSAHVDNPFRAHPENLTPLVVEAFALAATALALVIADRGAWRERGAPSTTD